MEARIPGNSIPVLSDKHAVSISSKHQTDYFRMFSGFVRGIWNASDQDWNSDFEIHRNPKVLNDAFGNRNQQCREE